MKKITIFDTALGTSNVGDEIILESIYHSMEEIFQSGFSVRLATHVNNFSALQMLRNNTKVKFFKEADWKFVCGTNLISQNRIGKVNAQWQLHLSNLPIYENCILIGAGATTGVEKMDPLASFLYRHVLSDTYIHSVRDEQTKKLLESIGKKAVNTGCPTLWKFTPEFCRRIPQNKAENCIISVSGYMDQQNREIDQQMVDIVRKNYRAVWAWIQTTEDEKYLKSLRDTEDIKRIYSLRQYSNMLLQADVDYIGTRLHGGIYALQHCCRSIIVSIDHRAQGFYKTNHIPIIQREDIENRLETLIRSRMETNIVVEQEAIQTFKGQFV